MSMWKAITSARYTVGALWLPSFTNDLLRRDYAGFTMPFNWTLPSTLHTYSVGSWSTIATVAIKFPIAWASDSGFIAAPRVTLDFNLNVASAGAARHRINGGAEGTETSTLGAADHQIICTSGDMTFATTEQTLTLEAYGLSGVATGTYSRLPNYSVGSYIDVVET